MKMSQMFGLTLKEAPADAQSASYQYMVRGAFIHQVAAGLFSYLPLARRVLNKIEGVLRREMEAVGCQEVTMPVVLPADIWKDSGRWYQIGAEMTRLQDRKDHEMCLAMTHEEALCDLAKKYVHSYKQMPLAVYHIQTKWRDDPRPRAGLIRVREFKMKDSYSMDTSWEGLDKQYRAHYQAYFNIFRQCGIDVLAVESDTGMMGGKEAHEFMYLTPIGEDTILLCGECGYNSNRQVAEFRKEPLPQEEPLPLETKETPDCRTIAELAEFLSVPASRCAKAVFMMAQRGEEEAWTLVTAILRGDMELNETKLTNAVQARELRPAREDEIVAAGGVPGYASPMGLKGGIVVVDDLIPSSANLVAGANKEGVHWLNVNVPRDFAADITADIAAAGEGSLCPRCGKPMSASKAVEVGNIFKLGTRYSEAMGCQFQDQDGKLKPIIMGSYGIGVGRLMSCIVEENHDDKGIVWPVSVAPYQAVIVLINDRKGTEARDAADKLYSELSAAGVEVLYDDRQESPGIKFNDADLIGIPLRLTVGKRALSQGGVEMKLRRDADAEIVPVDVVVDTVKAKIEMLENEIRETL